MKREEKWRRNVLFSYIRDLSVSMFSLFFTTCFSHQQVFDFVRDRNASVPVLTGATGECSSPESNVCADSSVGIRSTPVPGQSAKGAGGRSQLNTHEPYVCGCEWSDTLNWCLIVWCTQNVRRDGSKITWHQQWNNLTTLAVSTQQPGLPVPNKPDGICGRKVTLKRKPWLFIWKMALSTQFSLTAWEQRRRWRVPELPPFLAERSWGNGSQRATMTSTSSCNTSDCWWSC